MQYPYIHGQIAPDGACIPRIEIHFDRRRHIGVGIGKPAYAGIPVAYIEPAGMLEVESALDSGLVRSEAHTSELQSLMRISYAVFCLKTKKHIYQYTEIR